MSRVVRSSKYRHVFGKAHKREACYDGINPSKNAWDSNYVHCNRTFIAVCWQAQGGGSFGVIPFDNMGKLPSDYPVVAGHKAVVLDVEANPLNQDLVASCSEDGTAKIWSIPGGKLTETMRDPVQNLIAHKRKVGHVRHHPVADNVLATTSTDYTVKIWDIEKGEAKLSIDGWSNIIQEFQWNRTGSEAVTTSKDKKMRMVDPRQQKVTSEVAVHDGVKGSRVMFLGDTGKVFTVGFSRTSERQFAIWDPRSLEKPILRDNVDTSSGILMPFYDNDTNMIYLSGKGDGNVRYYEVNEAGDKVYFLSEFKSSTPTKGMCMVPKLDLAINECEVVRMLKLSNTLVEPISFKVPRKSEMFQDDIFPPTYSYSATGTADEWFGGKDLEVKTVSLEDGFVAVEKPKEFKPEEVKEEDEGPKDENALREAWKQQKTRIAYLEAELAKRDAKIKELGA